MTTSRLARGGKGRIFIYLAAILLLAGVIAIFHNAQQQLDDLKKNEQLCQHQQESLLAQMQVIIEYKARLEKSLQTERASHLQSQNALEAKIQSEKLLRDKHDNEDNVRLTTLQQHYKLLKSQHEDLEEECANTNEKHLSEISDLKRKIEEITKDLKSYQSIKFQTLQKLESENKRLLTENHELQNTLNAKQMELNQINDKLKKEIYHLQKQLDSKCDVLDIEKLRHSSLLLPTSNQSQRKSRILPATLRVFNKQIQLKKDVYQIRTNENKPIDPSIQSSSIHSEIKSGNGSKVRNPYSSSTNKQNNENILNVPKVLNTSTSTSRNYNNFVIQTSTISHLNKEITYDKETDKLKVKSNIISNKNSKKVEANKVNKNVPAGVLPIPPESGDSRTLPNQIVLNEATDVKNVQYSAINKHSEVNGDEALIEKENVAHEVLEDNAEDVLHVKANANEEANQNRKFNDGIQNNAEEDMYDNKQFPLVNRPVVINDKTNIKDEDHKNVNGGAMGAPDLYEDEQREMSLEEPEDDDIDDYGHDNKNQIAVRN